MKRLATAVLLLAVVGLIGACGPAKGKAVKDLNDSQATKFCEQLQDYGDCTVDYEGTEVTLNTPDDCESEDLDVTDVPDSCELTVGDYYNCHDKCSESACQPVFDKFQKCVSSS